MSMRSAVALALWSALLFVGSLLASRYLIERSELFPPPPPPTPGVANYQPVPFPVDTYPFCMARDSCKTIVPKPAGYQRWSLTEGTWRNDKVVR